jgi:hypothetical protein
VRGNCVFHFLTIVWLLMRIFFTELEIDFRKLTDFVDIARYFYVR